MEDPAEKVRRDEAEALLEDKGQVRIKAFTTMQIETGRGFLYSARLSKWYLLYCIAVTMASIALMIFLIVDDQVYKRPISVWVVALDGVLVAIIVLETVLDMGFLGVMFWYSGWHIFDFAVCITSILGWILLMLELFKVIHKYDEFITLLLLAARYVAQSARVIRYIYMATQAKATQDAVDAEPIKFESPEVSPRDKAYTGDEKGTNTN